MKRTEKGAKLVRPICYPRTIVRSESEKQIFDQQAALIKELLVEETPIGDLLASLLLRIERLEFAGLPQDTRKAHSKG